MPVPTLGDAGAPDGRPPGSRVAPGEGRARHGLGRPEPEPLGGDGDALSPLPAAAFPCVRWEAGRRGRQGTLAVGGARRHPAGPAHACREVAVALGAFLVTACDCEAGEVVATHGREWGEAPTGGPDPLPRPGLPCMRPNGWRDSPAGPSPPDGLVSFLDGEPAGRPRADPGVPRGEGPEGGWGAAAGGMLGSVRATGPVDRASVAVSAARAQSGDARTECDEEAGLGACDSAPGPRGEARGMPMTRSGRGAAHAAFRAAARAPLTSGGARRVPSSHRRPRARLRHARRCPGPRWPTGTARGAPAPSARLASPSRSPQRASTGRACRSPTAGAGRRCSRSGPSPQPRASPSSARRGGARPTWRLPWATPGLGRASRPALADRPARDAAGQGQARGHAGRAARRCRQVEAARTRRVRPCPPGAGGARLLFQVISESYGGRSAILATNAGFSRWGTVFADDKLAAAIVDRVARHGRLVGFGGPSHRLEESLMLGRQGR